MALPSKEPDGDDDDEADDPLIKDAMLGKTEERTDPLPDPLTDGGLVVADVSSSPMEMNGKRDFHPDFRSLIGSSSGGGGARIALTICLVTSASNPARGDRMDGKRNDPHTGLRKILKRVPRKGRAMMRVAQGTLMMMIVCLDHSCCSLLLIPLVVTKTVTLSLTFQYQPLVAT